MPKLFPRILWTAVLLCCVTFYALLGKEAYTFYGDALGYYMYLPGTFIYHNHQQAEKLPQDRGIRLGIHHYAADIGGGQRSPKGHLINQYTYGTALMELPAFAVAHGWEKITGGAANGFSEPYQNALCLLTALYAAAGLFLIYRFLRSRFSPLVAHLTTAFLLLGTNLFWFTLHQAGMAHVPLFFLFALLLHLTDRVHRPGRQTAAFLALGFVAGLITVIRPVNGLCVLLPLLYHPGGRPLLRSKMQFLQQRWQQLMLAALAFFLPILPQLLYWKWLSGSFFYDSYGSKQTLDLLHPKMLAGVFGASNGWLFYSPLMLFAVLGLLRNRRLGAFRWAVPVFLLLYSWAIYSWYVPNYPNGLGSRPMVDVYAIWALPLAAAVEWTLRRRLRPVRIGLLVLAFFLTGINLSYSVQQSLGVIRSEDTNYTYVLSKAFQYSVSYDDLVTWDIGVRQPDRRRLQPAGPDTAMTAAALEGKEPLETDSTGHLFYKMTSEYSPLLLSVTGRALRARSVKWIQCSGIFNPLEAKGSAYEIPILVFEIRRGDKTLAWYGIRINNKLGLAESPQRTPSFLDFQFGYWGTVRGFVPVPPDLEPQDEVRLFVWNIVQTPLGIRELRMAFFR